MAETNFTPNLGEFIQGQTAVESGVEDNEEDDPSPLVNKITIDGLEPWLWTEGDSAEMKW